MKCCLDKSVVGTRIKHCKLALEARKTALIIISVFPNATSPTINLSEGSFFEKSDLISSKTFNCSSVSTNGKVLENLSYKLESNEIL